MKICKFYQNIHQNTPNRIGMNVGTENQVDNIIIRFFIGGIQPEDVHEAVKQPKISDINNVVIIIIPFQ